MYRIAVWYQFAIRPFDLQRESFEEAQVAADEAAIEENVVGVIVYHKGRVVYGVNADDVSLMPPIRRVTTTGAIDIEEELELV